MSTQSLASRMISSSRIAWRVILEDIDDTVVGEEHDLVRSREGKDKLARTRVGTLPAERNTGAITNVDFQNHLAASIANIHVLDID